MDDEALGWKSWGGGFSLTVWKRGANPLKNVASQHLKFSIRHISFYEWEKSVDGASGADTLLFLPPNL